MSAVPTDRTYPLTRIVAALLVPALLLVFVNLYFYPDLSGERFAWEIKPNMSNLYIGAGYLGGAFLLFWVAIGQPWHRVQHGFLPITAFAGSMLVATLLHWDRFDPGHLPFQIWLALYILSPFLIPYLWIHNRGEDSGVPERGDRSVPIVARAGMLIAGAGFGVLSLLGLFAPDLLARIWVWELSPLTARVIAGWFALLAVGGWVISRDSRWSVWRIGIGAIFLWHLLVVVGAFRNVEDFGEVGLFNWYIAVVWLALAGMGSLFVLMESR